MGYEYCQICAQAIKVLSYSQNSLLGISRIQHVGCCIRLMFIAILVCCNAINGENRLLVADELG